MQRYEENFTAVFSNIRQYNDHGYVAFLGLYNPYNPEELNISLDILHQWNGISQYIVESDKSAIFIPSYDLFKWNVEEYISFDRLHPNSTGYKAIAQRMSEALKNIVK